jgi:hypothetical protein
MDGVTAVTALSVRAEAVEAPSATDDAAAETRVARGLVGAGATSSARAPVAGGADSTVGRTSVSVPCVVGGAGSMLVTTAKSRPTLTRELSVVSVASTAARPASRPAAVTATAARR